MRLDNERESINVEDRRGMGGGLGRGGVVVGGGIGTIVLLLIGLFLGVDPSVILSGGGVRVAGGGLRSAVPGAGAAVAVSCPGADPWGGALSDSMPKPKPASATNTIAAASAVTWTP